MDPEFFEFDPKELMGLSAIEPARVVEMEPEVLEIGPKQLLGMFAIESARVV